MGHQCFAAQWGCGRTKLPQPGERVWLWKAFELMGIEQKLLHTSLRLACFHLDTDPKRSPSQSWHWPTLLYSYQHHGKLGVSVLEYSEIFLGSQETLGARVYVLCSLLTEEVSCISYLQSKEKE